MGRLQVMSSRDRGWRLALDESFPLCTLYSPNLSPCRPDPLAAQGLDPCNSASIMDQYRVSVPLAWRLENGGCAPSCDDSASGDSVRGGSAAARSTPRQGTSTLLHREAVALVVIVTHCSGLNVRGTEVGRPASRPRSQIDPPLGRRS